MKAILKTLCIRPRESIGWRKRINPNKKYKRSLFKTDDAQKEGMILMGVFSVLFLQMQCYFLWLLSKLYFFSPLCSPNTEHFYDDKQCFNSFLVCTINDCTMISTHNRLNFLYVLNFHFIQSYIVQNYNGFSARIILIKLCSFLVFYHNIEKCHTNTLDATAE